MKQNRGNAVVWVLVVIVIGALAFYFGMNYGSSNNTTPVSTAATTTPVTVQAGAEYYSNPAEWQTYSNSSGGYSIAYPIDFTTDQTNTTGTSWMMNSVAQVSGTESFTLTIPAAFEPQTNFVDATLTVGSSKNSKALANCSLAQDGEATSTTQTINGASFTVFTSSNPGAGNLYDTTSYRTTHAGACYAVEYTVHSAELGNFPSSYDLQQFNETQVDTVMNSIVGTFTFL